MYLNQLNLWSYTNITKFFPTHGFTQFQLYLCLKVGEFTVIPLFNAEIFQTERNIWFENWSVESISRPDQKTPTIYALSQMIEKRWLREYWYIVQVINFLWEF